MRSHISGPRPGPFLIALFAALMQTPPVHAQHQHGGGWSGGGGQHGSGGWHGGGGQHGSGGWHGDGGWHGGGGRSGGPGWHGDIHHFNGHDRGVWAGGHWSHGPHGGHNGWWWVVGPTWYYYPAPFYPYPDPYWPAIVGPAPPGYWFYCPDLGAYYPYVAGCPGGWVRVLAAP